MAKNTITLDFLGASIEHVLNNQTNPSHVLGLHLKNRGTMGKPTFFFRVLVEIFKFRYQWTIVYRCKDGHQGMCCPAFFPKLTRRRNFPRSGVIVNGNNPVTLGSNLVLPFRLPVTSPWKIHHSHIRKNGINVSWPC